MAAVDCEFFVLRYVPDLVKNEFVNFGLVLLSPEGEFAGVRFARDLRRVRCLDANADLEMLHALESDLRKRLSQTGTREDLLQMMEGSFSGTIQLSGRRACRTESPEREIEMLARIHLEPAPAAKERRARLPRGRALLRRQMRSAFEHSGAAELMWWDLPVARYTHAGDPLKIDCGYRPNGTVKLFHAVPLKGELESAKALAFSYPRIARGIEKIEKAESKLTAIIEDDLDRSSGAIAFALDAFAQTSIAVAAARELPALAELARKELRV